MLASPQNTLVDNIWSHCCMRNSCQRDCSLKLVAWYKVCNKTPNDQPKIIDKRDRQGQNPAFSEFDLFARFTRPHEGMEQQERNYDTQSCHIL